MMHISTYRTSSLCIHMVRSTKKRENSKTNSQDAIMHEYVESPSIGLIELVVRRQSD
jgi:hypothetical protein